MQTACRRMPTAAAPAALVALLGRRPCQAKIDDAPALHAMHAAVFSASGALKHKLATTHAMAWEYV